MFPAKPLLMIKSRNNSTVRYVRKLHRKKARRDTGLFIMEGARSVTELFASGHPVDTLIYNPLEGETVRSLAVSLGERAVSGVYEAAGEIMDYISPGQNSQGILALVPQPRWEIPRQGEPSGFYIALEEVSDPGNLGTIIRSGVAFACAGIFLVGDCVDPFNPKTVRSTAGQILRAPVFFVENMNEMSRLSDELGLDRFFFSPRGEIPFYPHDTKKSKLFIFGSEARGFSCSKNNKAETFFLPMENNVESLNLGVCVSIIMEKTYSFCKDRSG